MIKKYSLLALQKAINHALALDPSMPAKIQSLQGHVLQIIISPLNVYFFIAFEQGQLRLLDHYNEHPDTIIHSSPLGLIRLSLLPASKVRSLFNDNIRMSGNIELGQRVKQLIDELDIDWEGHLALFTGDVVAHQVGSFVRQGLRFKRQISNSLRHNVTDFLQEESRTFPPREEVNNFFHDVDTLSMDTERLAAHINQLLVMHEIH
jgi:ubiquinone biosynthesis accessory factor UbiJ